MLRRLAVSLLQTSSICRDFNRYFSTGVTNVVNRWRESTQLGVFGVGMTTFVTCSPKDRLKMRRIDDVCNSWHLRMPQTRGTATPTR